MVEQITIGILVLGCSVVGFFFLPLAGAAVGLAATGPVAGGAFAAS